MDLDGLQGLDLGERIIKAARLAVAMHQFESVRSSLHRQDDGSPADGGPLDLDRRWQRLGTGGAGSCAPGR